MSATMKTMNFAIFAIVLCGVDGLTRRAQPSLVQSGLPLPQNSSKKAPLPQDGATKKALEDMEATMMRMVKSQAKSKDKNVGTPLKDFADLIMPHLDSMEGAVNASHNSDQTQMNSLGAAFTNCTSAKTTADTAAGTLLSTKLTQSTAHKTCRTSEGTAETNYQTCVTAMNSLESSKNTACAAYALANKVPNINLVPTPGQGASYRSWLISVRDWVINELANLDAANDSCVNATGLHDAKKLECEGTNGQGGLWLGHDNLKTQCDANQSVLESTTCSYADKVEDSCTDYSTCYTSANTSYTTGKTNLINAQSNRILEYNLVKRLKCYCKLFSDANGADLNTNDLQNCTVPSHSTSHLMLALPTIPPAPGTCQDVDQKPCTTSYASAEYGSLPSNAPAKTCSPCVVPPLLTTTTTTTRGTCSSLQSAIGCKTASDQMAEPITGLIVACKASGSGNIGTDFGHVCADGWNVCNGQQVWDSCINHGTTRSFTGCYKYDATQDCQGCGVTCSGQTKAQGTSATPCWDSGSTIDVAGMGSSCSGYNGAGAASCAHGGRNDFTTNNGGCIGALVDGVMCCKTGGPYCREHDPTCSTLYLLQTNVSYWGHMKNLWGKMR
mmetsp:Transcript_110015/g.190350  ORF Transcript_110015/g.190350 Transcript_110015/m.190350 type:complete len:612 (+) Transcript_110015:59-1894(+)